MAKLAKALMIECPKRSVAVEALWPVFSISVAALAYFILGLKLALTVTPFLLFFWVRHELASKKVEPGEVVIGWWHNQVHLYNQGKIKDSVLLASISSVAWLPKSRSKLYPSFLSATRSGTVVINSKTGIYLNPIGPLPVHVIKRLVHFLAALQNKVDELRVASESPVLDA